MIVTRGIGKGAVKAAIVAAGLCIGSIAPPSLPNQHFIVYASIEVRYQEVAVEDRSAEIIAESRVLVVAEASRVAAVDAESRVMAV